MNPFLYHLLMPKIPSYNDKPPTIYQILQAIVNYGADEKTKTSNLAKAGRTKIFDFEYPLSDKVNKEEFETMILNKFMMRRIGFETITSFKLQLCVKLNEIMPTYNKMFDFINEWDVFNDGKKTTRVKNYNGTTNVNTNVNSNNVSDRRYSELPQDEIENVENGKYMTDYNLDHDTGNTNSTSNSNDNNNENEIITETPADKINVYKEYLENKKNIYSMIFNDLESLFYQLV